MPRHSLLYQQKRAREAASGRPHGIGSQAVVPGAGGPGRATAWRSPLACAIWSRVPRSESWLSRVLDPGTGHVPPPPPPPPPPPQQQAAAAAAAAVARWLPRRAGRGPTDGGIGEGWRRRLPGINTPVVSSSGSGHLGLDAGRRHRLNTHNLGGSRRDGE